MAFDLNNLAITSTNSAMTGAVGALMNTLQSKIANGGRDSNCKFYYNSGAGGSILQVATKGVVMGTVSALKDEAVNAFNSLFDKKDKAKHGQEWFDRVYEKNEKDRELYGKFEVNDGNVIYALDDWGNVCSDALMLGIELESPVRVAQSSRDVQIGVGSNGDKELWDVKFVHMDFLSNFLVWYDTTAMINVDSDKNMVISRVQGRDYSRKELVSNGDIKFSVTGQITSGQPDVYPTEEVKKFIKVMQYKGIIKINNQILDQFGVKYIIITDFHISSKEGYKAVQNYSFNAIGLQPENEIEIKDDTVDFILQSPVTDVDKIDSEWEAMFKNQLQGLIGMAKDVVSQGAALATGMLDSKL